MPNHVSDGNLALAKIIADAEAAAYRRGVEDAARVARSHGCSDQTCQKCVGGAVEAEILALVEKEDG